MNTTEKVYTLSPLWLQDILVSLRGWEYRYRRSSDRFIHNWLNFLLSSEKWSLADFRDYQNSCLREMLTSAFANVPYYRGLQQKLNCTIEDFKSTEDIRYLPILEKGFLRSNEKNFLHQLIDLNQCTHGFTSGTTGTPINLYESQESFSYRMAFVSRLRMWAKLSDPLYPRRIQFTGRNIVPNQQKSSTLVYWRHNYPGNALLMSTTHITRQTVPYYIEAMHKFAPEVIDGYPSAILVIARIASRLQLTLPTVRAIVVSAETLLPEHRIELEEAYKCKVYNQYAASEPSCFWCDCEYGVMHINPEYGITEILDKQGNPVSPGEEGEVVVTSFLNPVMPLIRYRLGDLAILGSTTHCKCGRQMPQIERVTGRVDDILFVPERGYVGRLDPAFKGMSHIIEAQIVQETLNSLKVYLVPDKEYKIDIQNKLLDNLRTKLGNNISISFEIVESIQRGPNGKFRSVISKVKHLYPDLM